MAGLFIAGYGVGYITAPKEEIRIDRVTLILDWAVSAERAPFFMARERGFYAEEGLSVTILRGYGSGDTALRVEIGEGEFGAMDLGTSILAEGRGEVDLEAVMMWYHKSPIAVMWPPDKDITVPKDLEGKKIASNAASSAYLMFSGTFVTAVGLDVNEINFDFSAPFAKRSLVLSGAVDAMTGYITGDGSALKLEYGDVGMFRIADYGVNIYSNAIVVKESYVQDHPDIVRRFVRATLKGIGWALNNKEEALNKMLDLYPELDSEISTLEFEVANELVWNEETQQYGIGYMIPEKIENTINTIIEAYDITTAIPPEEIYTNEFVEDLPDEILFPL